MKHADKIPFAFILDHLDPADLIIKAMFGCWGIYANARLCLFLMDRERPFAGQAVGPMQNGVYIATTAEHSDELKAIFPNAEFQLLKQGKVWIFVSKELDEFEEYTTAACEMINNADPRVGR